MRTTKTFVERLKRYCDQQDPPLTLTQAIHVLVQKQLDQEEGKKR